MPLATPVEPAEFPWYDYRGFTFSLGLQFDGHLINSGHSGSAFDPVKGKPDVAGGMADQARIAYAKQAAVLAAAGLTLADVTRVVENVAVDGLAHYAEAEQVRAEVFGAHRPVVMTVVVDRLVRRKAMIEVEVHASPGGGTAFGADGTARWDRHLVREAHGGTLYLPTLLPVDADGAIVAAGDLAGQYRYCLERAADLLAPAGLSLADVVSTVDYTTAASRRDYPKIAAVRRELLGPVYPTAAGILMSRLHEPGVLVALDVVASRAPLEPVNPGWSRYDTLTYNPGVRAGEMLYLSGFAALDMSTQRAVHPGDLRAQAEVTYGALLQTLAAAGLGPQHLLSTVEYVTPEGLSAYRDVADVRRELLAEPYPTSTGIVCGGLLRPEFMLEVVATALVPDGAG
ncbi:MAG: RidA family protein [Jatrophihabitans sp.]|nr:MAG: RidA family protein [Jatrophihabitans sp.]